MPNEHYKDQEETPAYRTRYDAGNELLGQATRRRREVLGLTQEDVAERFGGPSVASLRTIENAQAENYRSKTLFSLDQALSWPRGTSIALLSGDLNRLDHYYKTQIQAEFSIDLFWADVPGRDFDRFVNDVIDDVSDEQMEKYDIPVRPKGNRSGTETPEVASQYDQELLSAAARYIVDQRSRRRDQPYPTDRDLLVESVTLLTAFSRDPRIRPVLEGLVPIAFAGIVNDWSDLFDDDGNLVTSNRKPDNDGER